MTFHKSNLSNIERRAKNLGLTMKDVEKACCDIIRNSEGLDPHKTFREVSDLKPLDVSVAEWDEPIWTDHIYQFLYHCEVRQAYESLIHDKLMGIFSEEDRI